ncbi:MAG: hypothetical protein LC672_03660, partial [Acidobacteria bacterium]|nr:hypothetical protein [Acidobacteriota bacterium]
MPLAAMVRALCQAATGGSDRLYEVMIKLTLMIDATANTYGLATWTQTIGERPRLKWVEGLEHGEIADAENKVAEALHAPEGTSEIKPGDQHICMVLIATSFSREGAAIYGRCVRPLTENQA